MVARRALAAVAALAASLPAASALFSTTLHGAPTEVVQPGTPGVATMQLQPWLTTVDPEARAPPVPCSRGTLRALRSRARAPATLETRGAYAEPLTRGVWFRGLMDSSRLS
jgi:hypothetical protein